MPLSSRVKEELPFLHFMLNNSNSKQSKIFLSNILSNNQYKVLQEIVENCLQKRIPYHKQKSTVVGLISTYSKQIKQLQKGTLSDKNLPKLIELLKIVTRCALKHYGEDGGKGGKKAKTRQEVGAHPGRRVVKNKSKLPTSQ